MKKAILHKRNCLNASNYTDFIHRCWIFSRWLINNHHHKTTELTNKKTKLKQQETQDNITSNGITLILMSTLPTRHNSVL